MNKNYKLNIQNFDDEDDSGISVLTYDTSEEERITIDERTLNIPTVLQTIGVENDNNVERVYFELPRYFDEVNDLSEFNIYINYMNANNVADKYYCDDVTIEGDNIVFSWLTARLLYEAEGTVKFVVCAIHSDGREWNSTLATLNVLEGLEVEEAIMDSSYSSTLNDLITLANETMAELTSLQKKVTDLVDTSLETLGDYEIVNDNPIQFRFKKIDGTYGDIITIDITSDLIQEDVTKTVESYISDLQSTLENTIATTKSDLQDEISASATNTIETITTTLESYATQEWTNTQVNTVIESLDDYTKTETLDDYATIELLNTQTDILMDYNNDGNHNSIFRGKYLGDELTDDQSAKIADGTFQNLYVGDYWTINNVNWRIAGFDYWYRCGETSLTTHHAVIVPDTILYSAPMNSTNTTDGAYVGSAMYTETSITVSSTAYTGLANARTAISSAFGSHVLTYSNYLANATTSGYPSAGAWYTRTCDLMTEQMVYGCPVREQMSYGGTAVNNARISKSQLPLFALSPQYINIRSTCWLQDVASSAYFCNVSYYGNANSANASNVYGVRPFFLIS